MLFLAESLLTTAGFEYDEIDETSVARMPLRPLVAVECDEDRAYIREALREVQASLDAIGCAYSNFVINASFVSVAGPTAYAATVLKEHDDKICQQQMTNTAWAVLRKP